MDPQSVPAQSDPSGSRTAMPSGSPQGLPAWQDLALEGVSVTFNSGRAGEYRALSDTSLKVSRGEVYCLLGPSGCGKTTVLHLIAGFARPTSRAVRIGERPIVAAATDRVVVFQDPTNALFPVLRAPAH